MRQSHYIPRRGRHVTQPFHLAGHPPALRLQRGASALCGSFLQQPFVHEKHQKDEQKQIDGQ